MKILILIFAEVLGLYGASGRNVYGTAIITGLFLPSGLIVALIMNTQAATASVWLLSHPITASLTFSPSAHDFREHTSNGFGWRHCWVMRLSINSHHFVFPIHVFRVEFDAINLAEFRSNDISSRTWLSILNIYMLSLEGNVGRDLTWQNRKKRNDVCVICSFCALLVLLSLSTVVPKQGVGCPPPSHLSSNVHSTLVMAPDVTPLSIICIPRTVRPLTTNDAV